MRPTLQSDFREILRAPESEPEPTSSLAESSVARRLVDALVARGLDTFFGIPGGPICAVFEAIRLHPGARLIASRHESGAAFAATSYQKATGRTPVVVVTAGPGITNAVTGVASAHCERVPMLVLAGDAAWASQGGRLAQDSGPEGLDAEQLYSSITRARIRVASPHSAVAQTLSAVDVATRPENPGPALVVLAIDQATKTVADVRITAPIRSEACRAPWEAVVQTVEWLANARRPLVVLGAGARSHAGTMAAMVEALGVPFVTTPSGKGCLPETHPLSLRHGGMAASMWARRYTAEPIDAVLVLGTDLDDTSMGPTPYLGKGGWLVHVDRNAGVFNRNLRAALAVTADIGTFAADVTEIATAQGLSSPTGRQLAAEIRATSPFDEPEAATDARDPITPHRAVLDLERAAGPRARFITDIGEHMLFALHYLTVREPGSFHIQLALGSMGSGIAGAIGLALADTTRPVICICGDGCMQMAGSEILLAQKERLPIVFAVFNDGRYNMVHHGMKQIFGAADPWDMPEVNFAHVARAMGVTSAVVSSPGEIDPAHLLALLSHGGPVVLDIRIDPNIRVRGGGRVEALQHMSMLRAPGDSTEAG